LKKLASMGLALLFLLPIVVSGQQNKGSSREDLHNDISERKVLFDALRTAPGLDMPTATSDRLAKPRAASGQGPELRSR
jgi:hypothetical protein